MLDYLSVVSDSDIRLLKSQVFEYSFCDKILYSVRGLVFHFLTENVCRPVLHSGHGEKSRE
jgi:hypothetical protein